VPRITDFCVCMYVFGCKLNLFRLCGSDFGITPLDGTNVVITCTAFCYHIARISFASYWHLFVCRLLFWRDYVYSGQLCLSKRCSSFFIHERYVRSVRRYCIVRNHAAVPVQLEIVILQYICWCVLTVWTFVFNQFSCFCQFLMGNFCYSIMSLYTLRRC